jgi:hypothetical protein
MRVRLILLPRFASDRPVALEWDSEAGTFSGPDADVIAERVDMLARLGGAPLAHPPCSAVAISDPRHDIGDLAACLDERWILPDELASKIPPVDYGGSSDFEVTY